MRHLAFIGVMVAVVATPIAFAGMDRPITGMWHGRVRFDMNHLPRVTDKRQSTTRSKYLQDLEQTNLTLTLKGDQTYTLMVAVPSRGASRYSGRWARKGSSITIEQVLNGKFSGRPQVFTLDRNEKSMAFSTSSGNGLRSTISYFR